MRSRRNRRDPGQTLKKRIDQTRAVMTDGTMPKLTPERPKHFRLGAARYGKPSRPTS